MLSKQLCKQLTFKDLDQRRTPAKAYISSGTMSHWDGRSSVQLLGGRAGHWEHWPSRSRATQGPHQVPLPTCRLRDQKQAGCEQQGEHEPTGGLQASGAMLCPPPALKAPAPGAAFPRQRTSHSTCSPCMGTSFPLLCMLAPDFLLVGPGRTPQKLSYSSFPAHSRCRETVTEKSKANNHYPFDQPTYRSKKWKLK